MPKQEKPTHAKPSLYAYYFIELKEIALRYGYNLVLHGSVNRDLDLIAIPWQEEVGCHDKMIEEFIAALGGSLLYPSGIDRERSGESSENWPKYRTTYHGRIQYVINLNRECGMVNGIWTDPAYYIDISVIPTINGEDQRDKAR